MYFPQKDIDTIHVCTEEIISDLRSDGHYMFDSNTTYFLQVRVQAKIASSAYTVFLSLHFHRSRKILVSDSAIKTDHSSGNQS